MQRVIPFTATFAALSASAFAQIGTPYCAAAPNSTGQTAALSATGSTDVALGTVVLVCSRLPVQSLGYFLVSRTQGFTAAPAGSSSNLCLGGAIGRYANRVLSAGAAGQVGFALDLTLIPSPSGPFAVQPGESLSFQYWHRDSGPAGPTSNFSQGLEIDFTGAASIRLPDANGEGFETGALHDIALGGASWGTEPAGDRLLAPGRSGGSGRLGALRIRAGEVVTLNTDH